MAADPGPKTSTPRTLRGIALDHVRKMDADNYCPQCGQPTNTGLPHSHYKEQEPEVSSTSGGVTFDPSPFKTK